MSNLNKYNRHNEQSTYYGQSAMNNTEFNFFGMSVKTNSPEVQSSIATSVLLVSAVGAMCLIAKFAPVFLEARR